jgi:predicted ATPase/DNA-binding CsgD family transcriptional regulator
MAGTTPRIHDGMLQAPEGDSIRSLPVGGPAWYTWLADATVFAFASPQGTFTARQEAVGHGRGGRYWKAYRRCGGKLRRLYLGRSDDLTLERLTAAAITLAQADGQPRPPGRPGVLAVSPSHRLPSTRPAYHARAGERAELEPAAHRPPVYLTSFIGREREIAEISIVLSTTRLLTLTGPGGVGKTRLALEAAAAVRDSFADGMSFVSVAAITDPALVTATIAQALGVKETRGRSLGESLKDELRDKALLLLLDNFEQVVAGAPLLAELLATCPRLTALVTGRSVLHLSGEREFHVPPLALPDRRAAPTAEYLRQYEAVRLFVERGQAVQHDFVLSDQAASAVADLCYQLDGLPLAIELAAARLRALPLPALLARLERRLPLLTGGPRDAPARQQTLRNTIAWSHDLLDAPEQLLFRRLAVLHGGTLNAIEAICCVQGGGPGATSTALPPLSLDPLDGVTSLVEKSLLRQDELDDVQPRYVMLETLREYALERLAESGEADAVRRRHALYYLTLAEAAEQEWLGPRQAMWLARLRQDHDNLRAALQWCVDRGYAEPAFRLGVALWWFWAVESHIGEGSGRLSSLLARFPLRGASGKHLALRAQTLRAAGMLASLHGDHGMARALQEEGLSLRRRQGDPAGIFNALEAVGMIASQQGDHRAARSALEEALSLASQLDDPLIFSFTLQSLGSVVHAQGDYTMARALLEDCVRLRRAAGEPHHLSTALLTLAAVVHDLAEHDLARRLVLEVLDLCAQHGDRRLEGLALANLGCIATAQGDDASADAYLRASLAVQRELRDLAGIVFVLERYTALATRAQPARAIRLAAAATTLRDLIGVPRSPAAQLRLDNALRPARQALGRRAFDEAWSIGSALTLEDAIAEALSSGEPAIEQASQARNGTRAPALTRREEAVAARIAQGATNRQIAAELFITEGTVANHVAHILNKLGYSGFNSAAGPVAVG